jgi:hypothetical protein
MSPHSYACIASRNARPRLSFSYKNYAREIMNASLSEAFNNPARWNHLAHLNVEPFRASRRQSGLRSATALRRNLRCKSPYDRNFLCFHSGSMKLVQKANRIASQTHFLIASTDTINSVIFSLSFSSSTIL